MKIHSLFKFKLICIVLIITNSSSDPSLNFLELHHPSEFKSVHASSKRDSQITRSNTGTRNSTILVEKVYVCHL